jgi:hypothetical protein
LVKEGDDATQQLARDLAARLAAEAPKAVKPALNDHIDLDPHDNGSATHKSIPLKKSELLQQAAAAAATAATTTGKPERTLSLGAPPPPSAAS